MRRNREGRIEQALSLRARESPDGYVLAPRPTHWRSVAAASIVKVVDRARGYRAHRFVGANNSEAAMLQTKGDKMKSALKGVPAALALGLAAYSSVGSAAVLDITTLSNRPNLISGGDALVQITTDGSIGGAVTLNGADV